MPTRNVNLTDELDRFVAKKVKTGRYQNASEVVRAGLRTLERDLSQLKQRVDRKSEEFAGMLEQLIEGSGEY